MTLMTNDLNDHFSKEGGREKTPGGREETKNRQALLLF